MPIRVFKQELSFHSEIEKKMTFNLVINLRVHPQFFFQKDTEFSIESKYGSLVILYLSILF